MIPLPFWISNGPLSFVLFVLTILTSIMALQNQQVMERMVMHPFTVKREKEWFRLLSSGFIHSNWLHLGVNAYTYYFFGPAIEIILGTWAFLAIYFGSMIIASIPSMIQHSDNALYRSLGASGAISGLVTALIMVEPDLPLELFFFIPMPAWFLGIGFIVFSFVASIRGLGKIAHDAHLFGALAGIVITTIMRPDVAENFVNWVKSALQIG
ncbi:MAG: rhomboid family intramembrane serine protease [Bacteroidia bacterium]